MQNSNIYSFSDGLGVHTTVLEILKDKYSFLWSECETCILG